MTNDVYQLLGISPEADQVRTILQPAEAPARQIYGDPGLQSVSDYYQANDQDYQNRLNLSQQAEIARQATLPTYGGQQARVAAYQKALQDALYERQTGALLNDLRALDPADPEHEIQQDEIFARHPIAIHALKDPRVASLVKRQAAESSTFQKLFDSDPLTRKEYAALKADQADPAKARATVRQNSLLRSQKESFAKGGGDPADFDQFVQDGVLDRAKVAQHLADKARVQKLVSTPSVQKKLQELQQAATHASAADPSEDQKRAWLSQQGVNDPKDEDWIRADHALRTEPIQQLHAYRQSLGLDPVAVKASADQSGAPPLNAEAGTSLVSSEPTASSSPSGHPMVKTKEEYVALPAGALYVAPDGKTRRKAA